MGCVYSRCQPVCLFVFLVGIQSVGEVGAMKTREEKLQEIQDIVLGNPPAKNQKWLLDKFDSLYADLDDKDYRWRFVFAGYIVGAGITTAIWATYVYVRFL